MLPEIGFHPDIIHCHDWHTGLVGTFLKEDFRSDRFYKGIKVIYTIHSFQYQGSYPPSVLRDVLGLPQNLFSMGNVAYEGRVNYLKAGIVYADAVTTVHSEYDGCEAELAAEPGPGLDRYLWTQDLSVTGIINGIDDDTYNPLALYRYRRLGWQAEEQRGLAQSYWTETAAARPPYGPHGAFPR